MIVIRLPVPPSANNAYVNVRKVGRVKSAGYKRWLKVADTCLMMQLPRIRSAIPVASGCALTIRLPEKTRGDASNRIKLVEDYLVRNGITPDDSKTRSVTITRDASVSECVVEIREGG